MKRAGLRGRNGAVHRAKMQRAHGFERSGLIWLRFSRCGERSDQYIECHAAVYCVLLLWVAEARKSSKRDGASVCKTLGIDADQANSTLAA